MKEDYTYTLDELEEKINKALSSKSYPVKEAMRIVQERRKKKK